MPTCRNKGCQQEYKEEENTETSCRFHSMGPVFHEGLKGWGCCSKKVVDFNEFLSIPGCTTGKHSHVEQNIAIEKPEIKEEEMPVMEKTVNDDSINLLPLEKPKQPEQPAITEKDLFDDPNAIIAVDTLCKRKGCNAKYKNSDSKTESCVHHPGQPLFHEGSKGYTCCNRKVLEFEEFLKIPGCTTGLHRFTDAQLPKPETKLRTDWYQTPSTIVLDIFAKKADKTRTLVRFEKTSVKLDIVFMDGSNSKFETDLFDEINPTESSFLVLGTKIELTLKKNSGLSWPTLEPSSNVKTWTTFGLVGTSGTVGSKEMIVNNDVPISKIA